MQRLNEWDNQGVRTIAIVTTMLAGCARMGARVAVGCCLVSVGWCMLAVAAFFGVIVVISCLCCPCLFVYTISYADVIQRECMCCIFNVLFANDN